MNPKAKMLMLVEIPQSWLEALRAVEKDCPDMLSTSDMIILSGKVCEEPKTGHWIHSIYSEEGKDVYKCSECGRTVNKDWTEDMQLDYPYCHCGAKMGVGE